MKKYIGILIVLVCFLTLGGCKSTLMPSIPLEVKTGNASQCGVFAVQEGKAYFINHYDKGTLYSMNIDGSEKRKLNDDRSNLFYVLGNQIYYQNSSDNSKLYSMKTDASNRHKLSDDEVISVFWNVTDKRIFYNNWGDNSALYSIKLDGSDRKKISYDDTVHMKVLGERIYYSGGPGASGLYSMKTDGSEKTKLSADRPFGIFVAGDWIYYANTSDNSKLYAIRTDGSNRHKLSDDYALNLNMVDGRIYYITGNLSGIYSIKPDGSDKQLISNDHVPWFVIRDGRIYYTMTHAKIYTINIDGSNKQLLTDLNSTPPEEVTYEFSASLHKDMPEYRFIATGRSDFVMALKVFDEKGVPILSADFSRTFYDEVIGNHVSKKMMDTMGLHIVDVNFDDYKDVIILRDFGGAHSNTWYKCWLWDPQTSRFVESKSFEKICNPALDPEKQSIFSSGGSGAGLWGGSIYKYIDGKFVVTNELHSDGKELVEKELINGEMVVVRHVLYTARDKMETTERNYYKNSKLWQLDHPHWYHVGGHHADKWLESK